MGQGCAHWHRDRRRCECVQSPGCEGRGMANMSQAGFPQLHHWFARIQMNPQSLWTLVKGGGSTDCALILGRG